MDLSLLELLRCPYCGARLSLVDNISLKRVRSTIDCGVLGCECCAFPVVSGIPTLMANDRTREAVRALEAGHHETALFILLDLADKTRSTAFRRLLANDSKPTYRDALDVLSCDAEGTYFIYRFSDPTYLTAETLLRTVTQHQAKSKHWLDLCGGSGHLTRVFTDINQNRKADCFNVLVDVTFWKLWLAARFTAPECTPVCCDANHPLPIVDDIFQMILLSDAFPYIWHKRLLANEMTRVIDSDGLIVMPHLHSALGDNLSAGNTLTPASYQNLFQQFQPRLFSDNRILSDVLNNRILDLSQSMSPSELGTEPALTLIASRDENVFRKYEIPEPQHISGELRVNPLYQISHQGDCSVLTLVFPSTEYEEEFRAVRRYLPETITLNGSIGSTVAPETLGHNAAELRRRRILLDMPHHYY